MVSNGPRSNPLTRFIDNRLRRTNKQTERWITKKKTAKIDSSVVGFAAVAVVVCVGSTTNSPPCPPPPSHCNQSTDIVCPFFEIERSAGT